MARVTVEDCKEKVPSPFELVLMASVRTYAIKSGEPITVARENDKDTVVALREIALGNLDIKKLREKLINSLRTRNTVDRIEDENLFAEVQEAIDGDESYLLEEGNLPVTEYVDEDMTDDFSDNIQEEEEK